MGCDVGFCLFVLNVLLESRMRQQENILCLLKFAIGDKDCLGFSGACGPNNNDIRNPGIELVGVCSL